MNFVDGRILTESYAGSSPPRGAGTYTTAMGVVVRVDGVNCAAAGGGE